MPQDAARAERHRMPPYWQRAHRDWRFWIGIACIGAALFIFIFSDNLALIPRHH